MYVSQCLLLSMYVSLALYVCTSPSTDIESKTLTSYNADTKKFYIVYETEVGNQIFHGAQEWYSYTELMKRKSGPVDECIDSSLSSSISSFSSSSSSSNMKQNSSSNMEQSDYPNFARMTERQQLHYLQVTTNGSEADESEWL